MKNFKRPMPNKSPIPNDKFGHLTLGIYLAFDIRYLAFNVKKNHRSFTLVELLLGLSIFAIIAVTLYGTFSSGLELSRRSEDVNRISREARWSLDRLSQDLESMVHYDYSGSYQEEISFKGGPESISFLLPTDSGLKVIQYYLREEDYGLVYKTIIGQRTSRNVSIVTRYEEKFILNSFVREQNSFVDHLQGDQDHVPEAEILSPNIKEGALKFFYAYLEGTGEDVKITWKDSWEHDYVPSGVRVQLTFVKPNKSGDVLTVKRDIYIPTGFYGKEGL